MEETRSVNNYPFIKSAYYPGKLLHASDFVNEQEYGNHKLEFINRKFHGWGIIDGLEVRTEADGSLYVSQGSAIDPQGRILVMTKDRKVQASEVENLLKESPDNFILGICYAEQVVETERKPLEQEKTYYPARIAETYAFRAFSQEEYQKLKNAAAGRKNILTEEKTLYENEGVKLLIRIPKVIPSDSIFRIRILVQTPGKNNIHISWRSMATLQGAFFLQSGKNSVILGGKQLVCPGCMQWEWEVCTEEKRKLPVVLEISHLEINIENYAAVEISPGQFSIQTAALYETNIKEYLWSRKKEKAETGWVPLAHLKFKKDPELGKYFFYPLKENDVRCFTFHPEEEENLRQIAEENGILDIRWRNVLKHIGHAPPPPFVPKPWKDKITMEQVKEMLEKERKNSICRGIAVIPIPKHYRRGQILFSDEISHGFPGEEVFLWCGRMSEVQQPSFWEHKEVQHQIISGAECLFMESNYKRWKIKHQAVRQNVEAGTFRIALTLTGVSWQERGKEVVISWIAVRSV